MDTGQSHSQEWRLVTSLIFMQFSSFMKTQIRSQIELVLTKIPDFFFFSWQYKLGKFLDFSPC